MEKIAQKLEELKFEDSEKPKRPPINNGKQLENAVLQSLEAIMALSPFDAPPEFLTDLAVQLKIETARRGTKEEGQADNQKIKQ